MLASVSVLKFLNVDHERLTLFEHCRQRWRASSPVGRSDLKVVLLVGKALRTNGFLAYEPDFESSTARWAVTKEILVYRHISGYSTASLKGYGSA